MAKLSNVVKNNVVKKTEYNKKTKYITFPGFNTMALATETDLIRKPDFDFRLKGISDKLTSNKSRHLQIENELKKLQKFDATYFRGKSYFEEDGTQNYLVFQPMHRYFKRIAIVDNIDFWKSECLPDEGLNSITASSHKITPKLSFYGNKIRVKFNGSCLKQGKVTYGHGKIVNVYIV